MGALPPSCTLLTTALSNTYSVHARILPQLEQSGLYNAINFSVDYTSQTTVTATRVATFTCPSEINTQPLVTPAQAFTATNYGASTGTWFVWDPTSNSSGDGAFTVNRATRLADFTDGLSNTVGMSEVKAYTAVMRDGNSPNTLNAAPPGTAAGVVALGGTVVPLATHTQWVNGIIIHTGFSTVLPPNTKVMAPSGGQAYDVDFTSSRLGLTTTNMTYVAITARSFHAGGVNAQMMDGSVRFIKDSINQAAWRALGTRAGGEVVGADAF